MTRTSYSFAALALALSACTPAAEKSVDAVGVDTPTPNNPFFGAWRLTSSQIAPWWDNAGDTPKADPAMATFMLEAAKSTGPALLTCDRPSYATNIAPLRGLFEGNLPDPAKDAAALGFTNPDVIVLSYSCTSGGADVGVEFPMLDDNTIMAGIDNMIYTFKRAGN